MGKTALTAAAIFFLFFFFCCSLQVTFVRAVCLFCQLLPARFIVFASFVALFFIHQSIFQSPMRRLNLEHGTQQAACEDTNLQKNVGCDIEYAANQQVHSRTQQARMKEQ
jgi:endonuclease/exonuclease/phosphatase (EEP) superfamily protein YafD